VRVEEIPPTGFCARCHDNCVFEHEPDEEGNDDPDGAWVSVCCGASGWIDGEAPDPT